MKKRLSHNFLAFLLMAVFLFGAQAASAQVDTGANVIGNTIALSSTNPITVATLIINIFLGLLATIAVGLILLGGFKWMTSEGNEDKIVEAKNILKNAAIGLAIILAAWGIVSFILSRFLAATGGTSQGGVNKSGFEAGGGFGAIGSCTVQSVYPTPNQTDVPRNTSLIVTFKEPVDINTICTDAPACTKLNPNVALYESSVGDKAATNITDVKVTVADAATTTLLFTPKEYLGNPTSNTSYTINFSDGVKKADGKTSMFATCAPQYLKWQFEVSTKLDLTPPTIVSIFPGPDNDQDSVKTVVSTPATGSFTVTGANLNAYAPAKITAINAVSSPAATATIDPSYSGSVTSFVVNIVALGTKAQLSDNANNSLAVVDVSGDEVDFPGYINLKTSTTFSAGNRWTISASDQILPDSISVGSDTYTFSTEPSVGYKIQLKSGAAAQASEIENVLGHRNDILTSLSGNTVSITSVALGLNANSLVLASSDLGAISVGVMHGGVDGGSTRTSASGVLDVPRNSKIQINFSEPINPMTVAGTITGAASNIAKTIKVLDSSGNIIPGKFTLSNGYKTVEFSSNAQCGVNACGGVIYCLPGNSHVTVEVDAAPLNTCNTDSDCATKAPFSKCGYGRPNRGGIPSDLAFCQDGSGNNYPTANLSDPFYGIARGVMDLAMNSLDGNRDGGADGPWLYSGSANDTYSENDKIFNDAYNQFLENAVTKRISTNSTLGEITGSYCSSCGCSSISACTNREGYIAKALNLSGAIFDDHTGASWILDENDGEFYGGYYCGVDAVYMNSFGGSVIPIFKNAINISKCDPRIIYDPSTNHGVDYWKNPTGDNYGFSFYTSDVMDITSPVIEYISQSDASTNTSAPVAIRFNKLISADTLKSGIAPVDNGNTIANHHLVNFVGANPIGYWIESNNATSTDHPTTPSVTISFIKHSAFGEGLKYEAQVGSGVNDIYQNCFKPSAGPTSAAANCGVDKNNNPSCCNGVATSTLGSDGNCK
ncbi:MAG: Ig-like domain-containing protein [Candidatus Falkowbacteria bacterium]